MNHLHPIACLALLVVSCQSTASPRIVEADPDVRGELFERIQGLEGKWENSSPDGVSFHVFELTAGGTVVRETMFPGEDYEMVNMYTLDGNSVHMTHYCMAGNQPRMRATAISGDSMEFKSVGVGDLKSPSEIYMGRMTLVFRGADHIEQRWISIGPDIPEEPTSFVLKRVP